MSKYIEHSKFRLDRDAELQAKNPYPHEGKFIVCGADIAIQKQKEGLKIYEIGRNGAQLAKIIEKEGSYAYLQPIPKDNLNNI